MGLGGATWVIFATYGAGMRWSRGVKLMCSVA